MFVPHSRIFDISLRSSTDNRKIMPPTKTRAPEALAFDSAKYKKKLNELREMERNFGRHPAGTSPITAEIMQESHTHARGSSQKKKSSSSARYAQGGGDGDDDHYDDDDDGSDESDGTDDYKPNDEEDDEEDESEEEDDKAMISPVKLERSVSTKLRANIDNFIDLTMDSMEDEEVLADPKVLRKLVLERLRVHDAKVHAKNLFRLGEDDLNDMAHNLSEGMKTAIATELFNRCTKGHSIVLRKELLKDDASRETCIDHFFDDNMLKNRLHNMVKHAVKDVMNFADDIDEVRERAFGGFMRSGGNYRATPVKQSKAAAEESKAATRGRPRKRQGEAAEDTEAMVHRAQQPGQPLKKSPKKKRKHSRSRSRDASMAHQ